MKKMSTLTHHLREMGEEDKNDTLLFYIWAAKSELLVYFQDEAGENKKLITINF